MRKDKAMNPSLLTLLGRGVPTPEACHKAGMEMAEFDAWWQAQLEARLPVQHGTLDAPVRERVEIHRDRRGIPHIAAASEWDLHFGYGYAMAQDRLWQMDFYRRQAHGRLSEILGADARPWSTGGDTPARVRDITARTLGFARIAQAHMDVMEGSVLQCLKAFAAGVNACIEATGNRLPIEFALLDYAPENWQPLDTLAIWVEFQYYLTVRLSVITMPELADQTLDSDPLVQAFLLGEADEESILPAGAQPLMAPVPVGRAVGDPEDSVGSNNWTLAGSRTASGHPLLASDPHIAFNAISCWYEVHLECGEALNAAGAGYIGVPSILFGRNPHMAWGITNNICSQRDLYREKTDARHPDCFLHEGQWTPARSLTERIAVREGDPIELQVRFSPQGPIVNHLLPEPFRSSDPVSLRWVGALQGPHGENVRGAEIGAMMKTNRARSCEEFRRALRDWRVPTLSMVFADREGHIGYQCTGHIPIRTNWRRGFRRAWMEEDAWLGAIPFAGLPAMADPDQGWIRTANNRTAHDDYPFPLSGTWATGYRARRIRQVLEANARMNRESCRELQMDTLSLRAVECIPALQGLLRDTAEHPVPQALALWADWDCRMDPDTTGGTLFETFFMHWQKAVALARFPEDQAAYVADGISGLAVSLLQEDEAGWFRSDAPRRQAVVEALRQAWRELEAELGSDPDAWLWGRVHRIHLHHPLSYLPALGELLDRGGQPVGGSGITICNTGMDPTYQASIGANYRIVADLEPGSAVLHSIDAAGQSGHPGSPHYCDQLPKWLAGELEPLSLTAREPTEDPQRHLTMRPISRRDT